MTTEDLKAFEEWLASEPSLIRTPSYDATAELAWQAAVAYATARERERCLNEARAVQIEYERSAHRSFGEIADQHNAAAQAALEISIAIRGTDGGTPMTGEYRLVPVNPLDNRAVEVAITAGINRFYTARADAPVQDTLARAIISGYLNAAPHPEHVKERANSLASTPVDDKKSGFSDIKPEQLVAHETTTNPVVDHKSENMQHKPGPPADLVKMAREFRKKGVNGLTTDALIAAFAAEYASELTRDWSARALIAEVRAETAEKALTQHAALISVLKQALGEERKSVWRDVLLTVSPEEALSTALEEEREACAKVAEKWLATDGRVFHPSEPLDDASWERPLEAGEIAAAIRARKGGENGI